MPIIRIERKNALQGKIRTYGIMLDGLLIGHIRNKETKEFTVQAGNHTLQTLCSPWGRSTKLSFQVEEGEEIEFEATSPLKKGARTWIWVVLGALVAQIYEPIARTLGFYQHTGLILAVLIISMFTYCHFHFKNKPTLFLQQKTKDLAETINEREATAL